MEKYKLYKLDDMVFKYYIEDTKRGKKCTKECVERKLLAMMLCPSLVSDNGIGCKRYQFGSFNILVQEDMDYIGMIYWSQKREKVTKEQSKHLKNLYALLGLSLEGHDIVGDIQKEDFENYLETHNLSNTEAFSDYFKEQTLEMLGFK